jgi:hypothetical protein
MSVTLCPVALAVHCIGCPVVNVCPVKTLIGDFDRYPPGRKKDDPTVRLPKKR